MNMFADESGYIRNLDTTWEMLYPSIRWLAFFCLATHPIYLIVNNLSDNGIDSSALRLLCCFLVFPFCFRRIVRASEKSKLLRLYSIALVFLTLPFFFFTIFLLNQADGSIGIEQLASRQIQAAFAVVAVSLLIYRASVLVAGLLLSFLFALLYSYMALGSRVFSASCVFGVLEQLPFWIFALVAGVYFNRNKALVEFEKLQTLSDAGSYLAHELRTPLTGISMRIKAVQRYLPDIIKGYRESGLVAPGLSDRKLALLEGSCSDVVEQVEYSHALITMFLMRSNRNLSLDTDVDKLSGLGLVQKALEMYPFASNSERKMIDVACARDFVVIGPITVFVHVLLNLLKNATTFAHRSQSPWVGILIDSDQTQGVISVSDRGPGVRREDRKRIFERFYSTSSAGEGFGVGLSFCKQVMEQTGGEIEVESDPYKLTRFTLRFPLPVK